MRYIFEKGWWLDETVVDDRVLDSDEDARRHAAAVQADYAWDCPADRNPSTVFDAHRDRR